MRFAHRLLLAPGTSPESGPLWHRHFRSTASNIREETDAVTLITFLHLFFFHSSAVDEQQHESKKNRKKDPFQLVPGVYGRCGAQVKPFNLDRLNQRGIQTILSLHELPPELEDQLEDRNFRLVRNRFPLGSVRQKKKQDAFIEEVLRPGVDLIQSERRDNKNVLVHCYAGQDRTGAVLAGYLMEERDLGAEQAIRQVRDVRRRALTMPGYEELLERFGRNNDNKESG